MKTTLEPVAPDSMPMASTRSARRLSKAQRLRVASLLAQPALVCMDNPAFHEADAVQRLFDDAPEVPAPNCDWYHPGVEAEVDLRQPPASTNPLLTAAQERVLFLQFNYARFAAGHLHRQLSVDDFNDTRAGALLYWNDHAMQLRDRIVEFNLALVLAMAKHVASAQLDFSDLMSEGNMALLRAVDKFDIGRNFKFSTYACRAILKGYSRMSVKRSRMRGLFPASFDPELEMPADDPMQQHRELTEYTSELRRALESKDLSLTPLERRVIDIRFPMEDDRSNNPPTLQEVGRMVGYSKERVRQIQQQALDKLREHMASAFAQSPF